MKNLSLCSSLLAALTVFSLSAQKPSAPEPVYPIPTQAQIDWQKLETYAFVHYGLCTYNDMEWGFGDSPESTFAPTALDVEQWARLFKNAGMKGILMAFKHHDGFSLWPTKYSKYNISNSPYKNGKGDFVKELIDACRKYKLKIGVYISPWDRNHSRYGYNEYVEYFHNQIAEIINEYCDGKADLFEFWFDGANGGDGYYGGEKGVRKINAEAYYDYARAKKTIHNKFPNAMIFGGTVPTIRWIGNEEGWAGHTNWSMWNINTQESRGLINGMEKGKDWLPGEVDVSIRPGWFYHQREDHQLRSLGQLVEYYYQSVGRNANLLLNVPVSKTGKIFKADSIRVMEWKHVIDRQFANNLARKAKVTASSDRGEGYKAQAVNDNNWNTYWATKDGELTGDLTLNFNKPTELNTLLLQEYIPLGQRIKSFKVEYLGSNNKLMSIVSSDTMSTIGYKRIIRFNNIKTKQLKVTFTDSRGVPCINNMEVFLAPAVLDQPTINRTGSGSVFIKGAKGTKIYFTTDNSNPTTASNKYSGEFSFTKKGTIKAIAYDPTSKNSSPIGICKFDILSSAFSIVSPAADKGDKTLFDGNSGTSYYLPKGVNSLTFSLGGKYTLYGLEYTPDQNRWGGGSIHRYKISIDGKIIKEGEFSNIKQNPVKQTIEFPATTGSTVTIDVLSTADNFDRASFAEISVLTK